MALKNFLARITEPRSDRQRQTGASGASDYLPGLRQVIDEVDTYFKGMFATPDRCRPMRGSPPPDSGRRTEMRAPKMLPWIARKAGISDELALKLWRRSAGESEILYGCCDSAEYYAAAVSRFLELVEDESEALSGEPAMIARTNWLWHHEKRMSQFNMVAAQALYRLWEGSWHAFLPAQKPSVLRLR